MATLSLVSSGKIVWKYLEPAAISANLSISSWIYMEINFLFLIKNFTSSTPRIGLANNCLVPSKTEWLYSFNSNSKLNKLLITASCSLKFNYKLFLKIKKLHWLDCDNLIVMLLLNKTSTWKLALPLKPIKITALPLNFLLSSLCYWNHQKKCFRLYD